MLLKLLLLIFVALAAFRGKALLGVLASSKRELSRAQKPVEHAKDITPPRG